MIEVSICTPLYGKINFTKAYLSDLAKLDPKKVEIILVDNASPDETSQELAALENSMPNLKVIRNPENKGFGFASNQAFSIAQGEHILFLNNDIRVKEKHEQWVFDLVSTCTDDNLVSPTGGMIDPKNGFAFLYETNDPSKPFNYLSGWCLAGKKTVFERLIEEGNINKGPFSDDFFCYHEDADLSWRAQRTDMVLQLTSVPVVHFGKTSSKQLNTYALYSVSKSIFTKKWGWR